MNTASGSRFERSLSAIITLCVVLVSLAAIYRLIVPRGSDPVDRTLSRSEWQELTSSGTLFGPKGAPVRVVVFVDYECPFCRAFHEDLSALLDARKVEFAVRILDFPLTTHPGAALAAEAMACSENERPYVERARVIYSWQDSVFKPDAEGLTRSLSVSERDRALACIKRLEALSYADSARAVADQFGVKATPTVIVDRKVLRIPPNRQQLEELLMDGE